MTSTGISARRLSKRFGDVQAVRELSFDIPVGRVTALLGPNGSGKTTTLRMLLGLVAPTSGEALIDGKPYAALDQPRRRVGAALDGMAAHPGRRAREHLWVTASAIGAGPARVDDVLEQVGLTQAQLRRAGGLSLGMRQRLSLATALLGDPAYLVLDEPANGLDPAGMAWLRTLLRGLAAEGRTVLLSSHVLSEVAITADHAVIINEGELRYAGALESLDPGTSLEEAFLRLTSANA
jgi:ABC-2 type transport system ATP-binding protein